MKTVGGLRKTRHRGRGFVLSATVGGLRKTRHRGRGFVLSATAYNLVRIPKLLAATG